MKLLRKMTGLIMIAAIVMSAIAFAIPSAGAADDLPEKYDSRDYGYITPVRNQLSYGTCWAHGTLAACEASLIKNNGYPSDLDLSEFHLAYSTKHTLYDRLGLFDTIRNSDFLETYMVNGGDEESAGIALACWNGPVLDSAHYSEFTSEKFKQSGLNQLDFASKELQYCMNAAHLTDYYIVKTSDIPKMKQYIMEYGAGTISLFSDQDFRDEEKAVWFYNQNSIHKADGHLMAVVGWDDTIPAEELSVNGNTPSQDGAFIIKNSWGTDCGSGGYYYVPYEPYMLNGSSVFFAFADADTYTYSYGYDDTTGCKPYFDENALNSVTAANVFTAVADDETLEAVSFFTENDNIGYEVRIYTDLPQDCASPEEGTLRASAEGSVGEHGYHTMTLHEAVPLKAGERFSVVVTLSGTDSERTEFVLSAYTFDDFKRERGESFLYAASRGWYDICDSGMDFIGNARIKAFTVSPSAPALVEPEDYDSYNGTAREQLLQQSEDAQARYAVMLGKGRFNFNFEDLDRLDNYAMIFDSISEYSDMYTASEIYATTSNFVALLDNVRPLDPTSLLLNLDYIARKMMSGKYMQELESWQEYKEKYDEIAAMAKRQEITPDSLYDLRQSLGESFIKLLEENIRCGYGVSRLQDYGDVDHDGKVTVLDATRIQRILAEIDENTLFSVMNGDVDADGEMTVLDATAIQKKLASIIGHFTVYDDNCYVEDAYTADSSREELKAYLRGAIEERAAWENMQITTDHEFDQILSYVIYHHAKEVLADADHMDKAVLLFYTRNLISHVRTRTW